MTVESTALFRRDSSEGSSDGATFVPNRVARGGWGESVSGHAVGGLLGWAVENEVDDAELQPARLTVDLPRPTAFAPTDLTTRTLRDGKRLRLIEATLTQNGALVACATGLFLRRSEQPPGDVWSRPLGMPPLPPDDEIADADLFVRTYGWGAPIQKPDPTWAGDDGAKYTWLNMVQPIIDGEPLTPFGRAAMAGDITASLANWGSEGLQFINADYTLTLSRLPEGPVLGLAAQSHTSHDGVATGSATLVDPAGAIGSCTAVALAHAGFRPPPA